MEVEIYHFTWIPSLKSQLWHAYLDGNTFWTWGLGLVLEVRSSKKLAWTLNPSLANMHTQQHSPPYRQPTLTLTPIPKPTEQHQDNINNLHQLSCTSRILHELICVPPFKSIMLCFVMFCCICSVLPPIKECVENLVKDQQPQTSQEFEVSERMGKEVNQNEKRGANNSVKMEGVFWGKPYTPSIL